jgi:hypothetical protein
MHEDPAWAVSLLVCSLATWRLTHLVVEEDGPFDLIVRARSILGDSQAGRAMDCFYCSSLWLAAPMAFALAHTVVAWLLSWLALSGAASLFEQISRRAAAPKEPEGKTPS